MIATAKRAHARHWKRALRFYLKVSLIQAGVIAISFLAVALVGSIWLSLRVHRITISCLGVEYALVFVGFFFLLTFIAALAADIHRNWSAPEPSVEWNPALTWKAFLYFGVVFFVAASFFS